MSHQKSMVGRSSFEGAPAPPALSRTAEGERCSYMAVNTTACMPAKTEGHAPAITNSGEPTACVAKSRTTGAALNAIIPSSPSSHR